MSDHHKALCKKLQARIEVLERRNEDLRYQLERALHGQQPIWTEFTESKEGIGPDGQRMQFNGYRVFRNSRYQVTMFVDAAEEGTLVHLSIKRNDGAAVRDWRDLQRIKNELIGESHEAVEIYPAEDRLVDGANQYHLWCVLGYRLPFGFGTRLVSEQGDYGVMQRPWEPDARPSDLQTHTVQQMHEAIAARARQ